MLADILQADKAEKKKQRKRLREAGQAPANAPAPVAPAVPHAETPPAGEGEAESVHKRQQMVSIGSWCNMKPFGGKQWQYKSRFASWG